ncbi:MAG TPA: ABC transporter permease [Gemmatimonadaceae bacterium]
MFGRRFRRLINQPTPADAIIDQDVDDEVAFHLDMRVRDLVRLGSTEEAAREQAIAEFGDRARLKRALAHEDRSARRDRRVTRWIADLTSDLRFAGRQIMRSPSFAIVAILTVALGIGANTAIMSAVRGILLQPLPFREPEGLVRIFSRSDQLGLTAVSVPDFGDLRARTTTFAGIAAFYSTTANMSGDGEPERLEIARVSDNWFDLLGVRALAGRTFARGEEEHSSPIRAVLSDAFWRRRFAADPGIIGRTLRLDGQPVEVIGVVAGQGAYPAERDAWMTTRFEPSEFENNQRGARWLRVLARLAPGASVSQANDDVVRVARLLEQSDPRHNQGYTAQVTPLHESIVGNYRRPLFILLGAVSLVMLVVCANVAGLMVARTAGRNTEIAVRTALGAGRGRIVRQLVTESLVLALAGGAVGFGVGVLGTRLLVQWAPANIPRLQNISIDATTFAYSLGLALLTGVVFGVAPALQASRRDVRTRLQSESRGGAGRFGGVRLRRMLVVSELAVAIVLLVGAGLLLRSFARLQRVDPGFRAEGLTAFTVTLQDSRYARLEEQRRFLDQALEGLRALPGVTQAAASFGLPLTDTRFQLTFTIDRAAGDPANEPRGQVRIASVGYFESMGIPLKSGRLFSAQDRLTAPQVAVISESLARKYFPDGNALGRYIETGWGRDGRKLGGTVVGIVGDVKQFGLAIESPPAYYVPADQWPINEITFVLRASSPASLLPGISGVIRQLDRELPLYDYTTGESLLSASLAQPRFYLMVIAAFAVAALMLAVTGVYGIIAYTVRQRTREIGVRMALGASATKIVGMILGEGLMLVTFGAAIGVLTSLALSGQITELLFNVDSRDWVTLVTVTSVLALAAIAACVVPARWASRLGPQEALRGE